MPVELHTLRNKLMKTSILEVELTENYGNDDDIASFILEAFKKHFLPQEDRLRRQNGAESDTDRHQHCSESSISNQFCDSPRGWSLRTYRASADEIGVGNNDNENDIIVHTKEVSYYVDDSISYLNKRGLSIYRQTWQSFPKEVWTGESPKVRCCDHEAAECSKWNLHLKMLQFTYQ